MPTKNSGKNINTSRRNAPEPTPRPGGYSGIERVSVEFN